MVTKLIKVKTRNGYVVNRFLFDTEADARIATIKGNWFEKINTKGVPSIIFAPINKRSSHVVFNPFKVNLGIPQNALRKIPTNIYDFQRSAFICNSPELIAA